MSVATVEDAKGRGEEAVSHTLKQHKEEEYESPKADEPTGRRIAVRLLERSRRGRLLCCSIGVSIVYWTK